MAEEEVDVKFGASIEGLMAGVEEAKEAIEGFTSPIASVISAFGELAEVAAAALAFEKIAEFAEHMGELGESTERTSKILGISAEQVGQLNYAAAMTGTSTGNLAMVMGRFEAGLPEAVAGTSRMAQGLKALGLDAKELIGVPLPEQLNKIADATSKFADGANKTAALQSLGRGFVQLIPLLDEGSKGMDELREKAEATGSVLSEEMTSRLVDMEHSMVNLGKSIEGLTIGAFEPFINVVNGAVALLTDIVQTMTASTHEGGLLSDAIHEVANAFQNLEEFISDSILILKNLYAAGETATNALIAAFMGFGQVVGDIFQALGAAIPQFFAALVAAGAEAVHAVEQQFVDLGTVINDTLHLNFGGAKAAFGAMGDDASASATRIKGAFNGVFDFSKANEDASKASESVSSIIDKGQAQVVANAKAAKIEFDRIWGIGQETKEEAPTKQVPNLQAPGKGDKGQAAKDAQLAADAEIETAKETANAKEKLLDEELKTHQISMSQWLTQTEAALQSEYTAVKAAYDKELSTAGLTSQQIIAIKLKEQKALADIAQKEADANYKAAEASQKSWDDATKQINSAFTGQIDGLLKGTTNWSTALKNVLVSLTEDVIKFFATWALKAVENEALQIASQNSITSGVLSAMGLQAAGQAAASKPGILAQIGADTGEAYAGFAAFLAPILGPAAPAAAGGLAAQVSATATGLASFDVGSWNLPQDQLAMVHAGEMIVPSRGGVADEFRNMASGKGGGGDTTHNHTYNINGASDPHQTAREVARLWQSNPSMRPRGY